MNPNFTISKLAFFCRTGDTSSKSFPEFNMDDFKSSCLNSDKDMQYHDNAVSSKAKKSNEVLMPTSMSMPTIASPKPAPQVKYVKVYLWFILSSNFVC